MTQPRQGYFAQFVNLVLFAVHVQRPQTLRTVAAWRGDHFRLFGGTAYTNFHEVRALVAAEGEKLDWLSGPLSNRAEYLTKSHMPFLLNGPNHEARRKEIVRRVAIAHGKLDDLEALLREEADHERALARFLFRHLGHLEITPKETTDYLEFRSAAQVLTLLPSWFRSTVMRSRHQKARAFRERMLQRLEGANDGFADTFFDAIWFNAGTMGGYPPRALTHLKKRTDLVPLLRNELNLPAGQRPKCRAMINEMMRIELRIASTNYVRDGDQVEIALLATAVVDPNRYPDPMKVDLDRDHSDALAFAGAAPTRGCPSEKFAPDVMATVLAHLIRRGDLG
jgi:cytochrome P450